MLTLSLLRKENVARCEEHFCKLDTFTPSEWLGGAYEAMLKVERVIERMKHGSIGCREAKELLGDQIAETIMYLDLLAARAGSDLEQAVRRRFNAESKRIGSGRQLPYPGVYRKCS